MRDVSADKLKIYIEGEKVKEVTDASGGIGERGDLIIGNRNTNFDNPFIGSLDELSMYNSALTDAEIAFLYHSTSTSIFAPSAVKDKLQTYPNPFSNVLHIINPETTGTMVLNLIDLRGRLIFRKAYGPGNAIISIDDLNSLPKGPYICSIVGNLNRYVSMVIKK